MQTYIHTYIYISIHIQLLSIYKSHSWPSSPPSPITGALGGLDVTRQAESSVHTRRDHSNTVHLTNLFFIIC